MDRCSNSARSRLRRERVCRKKISGGSESGAKHFWKSKCYKHLGLGPFFDVEMLISKSKCAKHTILGALLGVDLLKKCPRLWHQAHFEVTFRGSGVVWCGRRNGFCTFSKVSQIEEDASGSGCISLWQAQYKRHIQQTCSEKRWFPERVC